MPYLGRRDSDYAEMGVSVDADAAVTVSPLESRATELVFRIAHDAEDRQFLLETLGLVPTVTQLAAAG